MQLSQVKCLVSLLHLKRSSAASLQFLHTSFLFGNTPAPLNKPYLATGFGSTLTGAFFPLPTPSFLLSKISSSSLLSSSELDSLDENEDPLDGVPDTGSSSDDE